MVITHPRDRDLENDLSEQLRFLVSSATAFDGGELPESKRIAVAIRVLVHDTNNSHSLLAQLGIKTSLTWADSAPVIDRDPNIVGRSPGLTAIGIGSDGIIFVARMSDQIEQSVSTRYVSFDDWWHGAVLLDANGAEFSRKDLVLALANKDGGAHIDRLNENTYALVHSNSTGFTRFGGDNAAGEPIPTPIYASVRTIAEELLLTLRRSGRDVPCSTVTPPPGIIDGFLAGDIVDPPPVFDKSRTGVSSSIFKFDTLPGVTFTATRAKEGQSDDGVKHTFPAGWLDIVGVLDATGEIVHGSGVAGPTEESAPPPGAAVDPSTPTATQFIFDNFPQATFSAKRSVERRETAGPFGLHVQEAGWVDLFVTLSGSTWPIGGFAGPGGS
ncbi:hypothetical protein [Nocardia tengchongensis]|uniref:hypothetical protein n=1 Tax=Nocardia tengchongensis TaxID=2055889 RepID=UPI003678473E